MRDKEKNVIFVKFSINAKYLFEIFWLTNIKHLIILSHYTNQKKNELIRFFDETSNDHWMLIMIFVVKFIELNCQHFCWKVHIFEQSWSIEDIFQIIERIRRFENSSEIVYVTEYHLSNDINNRKIFRILHKAISKTMTNLNKILMSNAENDAIDDFEMNDITNWIMKNEEFVSLSEAIFINIFFSSKDLIMQILLKNKEKYMTIF